MARISPAWLLGVLAAAAAAGPDADPDSRASRVALVDYLGSTDDAMIRELVTRARQDANTGAKRAPAETRTAHVFLTRGLTGAGVRALLEPRSLELVGMTTVVQRTRVPTDLGSMTFDAKHLELPGANIAQRVDRAIAEWRRELIRSSGNAILDPAAPPRPPPTEAEVDSQVPHPKIYRLDVTGRLDALVSLQRESGVRAVFVKQGRERGFGADGKGWPDDPALAVAVAPLDRAPELQDGQRSRTESYFYALMTGQLEAAVYPPGFMREWDAELAKQAKAKPAAVRGAIVIFRREISARALQDLLEAHQLRMADVGVRVPVPPPTGSVPFELFEHVLGRYPGDAGTRIEAALLGKRAEFARRLEEPPPAHELPGFRTPEVVAMWRAIADGREYGVFKVGLRAELGQLARLRRAPEVFGVFFNTQATPGPYL